MAGLRSVAGSVISMFGCHRVLQSICQHGISSLREMDVGRRGPVGSWKLTAYLVEITDFKVVPLDDLPGREVEFDDLALVNHRIRWGEGGVGPDEARLGLLQAID